MKRESPKQCAYCRGYFGRRQLTKDHVPPQGVFGKEWRKGQVLPWVYCCNSCREGQSKGDEALKVVVGMGIVRTEVSNSVRDDVLRSLARQTWWKKGMIDSIEKGFSGGVDIEGIGGAQIMLAEDFVSELDGSISRISRGLIFQKNSQIDTSKFNFEVRQYNEDRSKELVELVAQIVQKAKGPAHLKRVGDAFFAAWWLVGDPVNSGIMLQNYFGGLNFIILFSEKNR